MAGGKKRTGYSEEEGVVCLDGIYDARSGASNEHGV